MKTKQNNIDNTIKHKSCIAILGGTFNPVHKGHIYMAEQTLKQCSEIETLYLMPNNSTAYKDNSVIVSNEHRINMLNIACEGINNISVSNLDLIRGGITYTIDTLNDILKINNNLRIGFVIGADSLLSFDKWRNYKDILKLCFLIVINRDDKKQDIFAMKKKLENENGSAQIIILDIPEYKASSTEIRRLLKEGIDNIPSLDDKVLDYIKKNHLYK